VSADSLDAIDSEIASLLADIERRGLEAPFPEPRPGAEFSA
jgi:hypothetical protein